MRRDEDLTDPGTADLIQPGWPTRAAARWGLYTVCWVLLVGFGVVSDLQPAWRTLALTLGAVTSALMVCMFSTLFERTSHRCSCDEPNVWCFGVGPWIAAATVFTGTVCLVLSGPYLATLISREVVNSPSDLLAKYGGKQASELPRVVCVTHAFVKTDWESGKLVCTDTGQMVDCKAGFTVAPVFVSLQEAMLGAPETIYAWACTRGAHVSAEYRQDGTLCTMMTGKDLEFGVQDFGVAIMQVITTHQLANPTNAALALALPAKPRLLVGDPIYLTQSSAMFLGPAVVLLGLAGPLPLLLLFLWFGCVRRQKTRRYGYGTDEVMLE